MKTNKEIDADELGRNMQLAYSMEKRTANPEIPNTDDSLLFLEYSFYHNFHLSSIKTAIESTQSYKHPISHTRIH